MKGDYFTLGCLSEWNKSTYPGDHKRRCKNSGGLKDGPSTSGKDEMDIEMDDVGNVDDTFLGGEILS